MLNSSQKTKNSTNRKRGSISKAMDRMAQSPESRGGRDGESSMMMSMLSMQMQNATQQMSMQWSMFQQQLQMQMSMLDKRAETNEKYLRRLAKSIGSIGCSKKRKRSGGVDDSDNDDDSSDEDN